MRLFVYGTLKIGHPNHIFIKKAEGKYLGSGKVEGFALTDLGGCPAAFIKKDSHIFGEVYLIEESKMFSINALERGYNKIDVNVQIINGATLPCKMFYIKNIYESMLDTDSPRIKNGVWI